MSLSSGVVAVPGEKMGSRVAASLTAAINCPNTIARNEDDYAEIAVAFGRCALSSGQGRSRVVMVLATDCQSRRVRSNSGALRRAKACVRKGKIDAPLFDTGLWVSDQERALRMASGA